MAESASQLATLSCSSTPNVTSSPLMSLATCGFAEFTIPLIQPPLQAPQTLRAFFVWTAPCRFRRGLSSPMFPVADLYRSHPLGITSSSQSDHMCSSVAPGSPQKTQRPGGLVIQKRNLPQAIFPRISSMVCREFLSATFRPSSTAFLVYFLDLPPTAFWVPRPGCLPPKAARTPVFRSTSSTP